MISTRGTLILLTVLLAIGAGCTGGGGTATTTPTAEGSTLRGVIDDARTGDGVPGVTVTVDDRTAETDSEGEFVIEGLPEGEYTLVAEKPGYLPVELRVSVSSDRQIAFTMRDEAFYRPNQSALIQTHWENDLSCQTCHANPEGEIQEPAAEDTCVSCHPIASLQNETDEFNPNPHDDPHGIFTDCSRCHRVHEASVDACAECHSSNTIPPVP